MGKGRRRGGGPAEDQFGEVGVSQDKQEHFSGGRGGRGGGGTGGGTAGGTAGGGTRGADLQVQRHVPKFLQAHAHLLGAQPAQAASDDDDFPDDPQAQRRPPRADAGGDASDFDDDEEAALRRALEENPDLAGTHPDLAKVADRMKAAELKEKGNKAFAAGSHEEAAEIFSQCIAMDPGNEVYWSNRAAAYIATKRYSDAERDARKVTQLKPSWVKGWARLGAALMAQGDAAEAREALQRAAALEPNDASLQTQLSKAMAAEAKEAAEGHHKFKRKRPQEGRGGGGAKRPAPGAVPVAESLAAKKKQLLSFGDDEEEDGE